MTLPLIDTHQHVWEPGRSAYSWLAGAAPEIAGPMTLDAVRPQMTAAGVRRTVLVQADDTLADTEYMLECAARFDEVVGVVAYMPLDDPEACAQTLERYAATPVVVGVRSLTHERDDPDYLLRSEVGESLFFLERSGLPLDLIATTDRHLEVVPELSAAHPYLRMVVDHLAKPPFGEGLVDSAWWTAIARAATNPLLAAKVSGLYVPGMAERDPDDVFGEIRPAFDRAIEVFGSARLMVGSDWPMSVPFGGYPRTSSILDRLLDTLDPLERDDLAARTATRHYGLDLPDPEWSDA